MCNLFDFFCWPIWSFWESSHRSWDHAVLFGSKRSFPIVTENTKNGTWWSSSGLHTIDPACNGQKDSNCISFQYFYQKVQKRLQKRFGDSKIHFYEFRTHVKKCFWEFLHNSRDERSLRSVATRSEMSGNFLKKNFYIRLTRWVKGSSPKVH